MEQFGELEGLRLLNGYLESMIENGRVLSADEVLAGLPIPRLEIALIQTVGAKSLWRYSLVLGEKHSVRSVALEVVESAAYGSKAEHQRKVPFSLPIREDSSQLSVPAFSVIENEIQKLY